MTTVPPGFVQPKPKFWMQLAAGGIAGVTEITAMYWLDVLKTRAQLQVGGQQRGMFATLKTMIATEGFGIYRGVLAPIVAEAPKRAVKFGANEAYRPFFQRADGTVPRSGAMASGALAGITEAFVVVPFDLIKVRMQAKENHGLYSSTIDCLLKVVRSEGPLALMKGLESTMWRHGVWSGIYFGLIQTFRDAMPKATTRTRKTVNDICTGTLAGCIGVVFNTPPDVVKSRIQQFDAQKKPGQLPKYLWTIPSCITIAREEGVRALYKGFVPKVLRLGPGGGILLVVFDATMLHLNPPVPVAKK